MFIFPIWSKLATTIVYKSSRRTRRGLCKAGIADNKWVPISSLDTRVLSALERETLRNFSSLATHIVLIFVCLYFQNTFHMFYLRYVAQYIVTRIVFYNNKLLTMGIYYVALPN